MTLIPASFRACLQACIVDGVLTLSYEDGTRSYSAEVALEPIAQRVAAMIRHYHRDYLHGDMAEETIAGLGGWYRSAVHTASRVASAKAAGRLWKVVQEHHGEIEKGLSMLGPYGQAAAVGMKTGFTVQSMLTKAKNGDPTAIGDVQKIVALSKEGDPSAQQVTHLMRTMNELGKRKEVKLAQQMFEQVSGWGSFYSLGRVLH